MSLAFARKHKVPLILAVLGAALRLLLLNSRSLWFDETTTLYISQSPLAQVAGLVGKLEENPPLHYLLMHFWAPLWRDPVLGLRLFSALCGAAALPVFYSLCRRLVPEQADFALLLAAVSSFWIHFSQDGRIYELLLLLSLGSAKLFLDLLDRWSWKRAAGYGAVCAAGLYTHNFFAFVLASQAAWLLYKKRKPAPWLAVYAAVAVLYLPWLSVVLSQIKLLDRASVLSEPMTLRNAAYVAGTMVVDTSFLSFAHVGETTVLGALVLVILPLAVWKMRKGQAEQFCLVQLALPFLLTRLVEAAFGRPMTQARYLIASSPFLYILLARVLDRPLKEGGRFLRIACAVVFAAGTGAYFWGGVYADPKLGELAGAIRASSAPADVVVHLDPYWYLPLRYYYLTDRTHKLAGPDARIANWEHLPGYPSYISRDELIHLNRCIVVDPRHLLVPGRVGWASGKDIAAAVSP